MTTFAIGGQSSGDFRETSARVQLLHVVTRNAVGVLTPDAFTQANPADAILSAANPTYKSTTLATITKVGVLGGSVAFTRPDFGNGFHGGPITNAGPAYPAGVRPLGIFINDAIGNAFENTPGVASGRGPYVCGSGTTVGDSLYETKVQTSGAAITYAAGNFLYASPNGLVTNVAADAYEGANFAAYTTGPTVGTTPLAATVIGVVKVAPDANSSLLVFDLRI